VSAKPDQNRAKVAAFLRPYRSLPFDDEAALIQAQIRHELEKAGTPIGPYDLQIAAIALANGQTLVTHNTNEFSRVPCLPIEDWETP
jgi:tRNA(fMet)-specific endonuclease VapC